jgi:hypothetical protein
MEVKGPICWKAAWPFLRPGGPPSSLQKSDRGPPPMFFDNRINASRRAASILQGRRPLAPPTKRDFDGKNPRNDENTGLTRWVLPF